MDRDRLIEGLPGSAEQIKLKVRRHPKPVRLQPAAGLPRKPIGDRRRALVFPGQQVRRLPLLDERDRQQSVQEPTRLGQVKPELDDALDRDRGAVGRQPA